MASEVETFYSHDERFNAILGDHPTIQLLAENETYPFAHEAGVYMPATDQVWVTSNRCIGPDNKPIVHITRLDISEQPVRCQEITTAIPMANGGVNYRDQNVLICAQGSLTKPSGLYLLSATAPYTSKPLITSFYGRPFNSVNDVVVSRDKSIWFTDPTYGYEQGYRPLPRLPSQVYRWNPETGNIRAMADGFGRPNGICFSPDETIVYITDTDWMHGDGSTDDSRVSSIYAFDIVIYDSEPFLANRRLFAMADVGIPDGIKCDMEGNVYSGCGDGINVWSPGGVLVGRILVEGGVANFCFGPQGQMFTLNEHRLWKIQLGRHVKGALLGI